MNNHYDMNPNRQQTYRHPNTYNSRVKTLAITEEC